MSNEVSATGRSMNPNDSRYASSCASNCVDQAESKKFYSIGESGIKTDHDQQAELKTVYSNGEIGRKIKIDHDAQKSSDQHQTKTHKEITKEKSTEISKRRKRAKKAGKFPVEPSIVQIVKKPRTYMNHSYRDFSKVPPEATDNITDDIEGKPFPFLVHHILSQEEYAEVISWMPHGRAFRVLVPKMLEKEVLQKYFGHRRFSTFLRQLSNHGFKHITKGTDRNCYYHEFMLRGLPHLYKYIPKAKDTKRLIPDPENEPDFYTIAKAYPLPGEEQDNENAEGMASEMMPDCSTAMSSLIAPTPVETHIVNLLGPSQSNTESLTNQMAWLENQLNPISSANLNNSIYNLNSNSLSQIQQPMPYANFMIPPTTMSNAPPLLQPNLYSNATMIAALQGMQASQPLIGSIPLDNTGGNLGSFGLQGGSFGLQGGSFGLQGGSFGLQGMQASQPPIDSFPGDNTGENVGAFGTYY